MNEETEHRRRVAYFNARYWKVAQYNFRTEERASLRDHAAEADRRCRFCSRGVPNVEFRELAHAVPAFLGNLSIISLNVCDECNGYFGRGCEDDLSKATLLPRTLAGIPRKKGAEDHVQEQRRVPPHRRRWAQGRHPGASAELG